MHTETREGEAYVLVHAREDKRLGPLIVEGLILSCAGGVIGFAIAVWGVSLYASGTSTFLLLAVIVESTGEAFPEVVEEK